MRKRIISIFLALALCLSLLATGALAAEGDENPTTSTTRIDGNKLNEDGYWLNDGTEGSAVNYNFAYDFETNTLTLNNANLSVNGDDPAILCHGDLTIVLEGSNTVSSSTQTLNNNDQYYLIDCDNLTIKGDGTLTVTLTSLADISAAIYSNGSFKLESGTVNAKITGSEGVINAVRAGSLSVSAGASARFESEAAASRAPEWNVAVDAGELKVAGTLTAVAGDAFHNEEAETPEATGYSIGVDTTRSIVVSGNGSIDATANGSTYSSIGLRVSSNQENLTLTASDNAKIIARAVPSEVYTEGISADSAAVTVSGNAAVEGYSNYNETVESATPIFSHGFGAGSMNISGGTVKAIAGNSSGNSYGIYGLGTFSATGGSVTAVGGETENTEPNYYTNSFGILATGFSISGSAVVDASSGKANYNNSSGNGGRSVAVFASDGENYGEINISGAAQVTAEAGESGMESYGIIGGSIVIGGNSKVSATGKEVNERAPAIYSYGLRAEETIDINGGEVTAQGEIQAVNKVPDTDGYDCMWALNPDGTYYSGSITDSVMDSSYLIVKANDGSVSEPDEPDYPDYPDDDDDDDDYRPSAPSRPEYEPEIETPDEGGSVSVSNEKPEAGDSVVITAEPDEGRVVDRIIITDAEGNPVSLERNFADGTWSFEQPPEGVTITVTFKPGEPSYGDVAEGSWYEEAVDYSYTNSLMEGVSDGEFAPESTMTRGMFWTVLARMDCEIVTGSNWLVTAGRWAVDSNTSDGSDPDGVVTREQLVTMLWRYAGEPGFAGALDAFTDAGSVSDYASAAMAWAVENGIIGGVADGVLDPQGSATRAQCAAILMRFVESILK